MGRICPILNHPLKDGVLVNDDVLVNFIQKRNLDFLPNELVCRSCKREVTKLYNKKLKKAIELHKSRFHDGSVSSRGTSTITRTSTSEHSVAHSESQQNVEIQRLVPNGGIRNNSSTSILQRSGGTTNSVVQNNHSNNSSALDQTPISANIVSINQSASIRLSTSINNNSIIQENLNIQDNLEKTIPGKNGKNSNVTVRRRTIKDFLTVRPRTQEANVSKTPQIASDDGEDVIRRLSQQPTTSNAAVSVSKTTENSNKRPISVVIDESDDDESLSLNAVNGTRLPHIQPIPPKRKPVADRAISMARDIMDDYIKDITGG